jgi:hypothetical protein
MKRLGWWSAVVAFALVAAGCGSSHHAAKQGSSVSLDIPSQAGVASSGSRVELAYVRGCLERHGWPVERVSHNEIDSPHGSVVWDLELHSS